MCPRTNARVALYSHDSTGLGHVRRNLLIAGELSRQGHDVLLVSGSPEATAMTRPPNTDLITLPALSKSTSGRYQARHLNMELDELLAMRRRLLTSALLGFGPDLLVTDRHARGFLGELEPVLDRLPTTRKVLGLRDVLDAPDRIRDEWRSRRTDQALAGWYDEIWHYGDARLFEPLRAASISVPVPLVSTGYLVADRPPHPIADRPMGSPGPFVLCMVGGGSDGERLASAVLDAALPEGLQLLVVTGPQMPRTARDRLAGRAAKRGEVTLVDYLHDPAPLLRAARGVIVMGGYNTVCEVLGSETPALVVPRDHPRVEQTIRAEALRGIGSFEVVAPARATGASIGGWLAAAVREPRRRRTEVDLDGLRRLGERCAALIGGSDAREPIDAVLPLIGIDGHVGRHPGRGDAREAV